MAILMAWPIIPIYWLPLRLAPGWSLALGKGLHLLQGALWILAVGIIWHWHPILLSFWLQMPAPFQFVGWSLFCTGLVLQAWTAIVLGIRITGLPELGKSTSALERKAPFSLCRHPTYLAHLLIFGGAALFTGFAILFLLALVDFFLSRLVLIPLEEKELEKRFGQAYRDYKEDVPCFFPKHWRKDGHGEE